MKVLAIHNFHKNESASGDDQIYKNKTKLLEKHGNKAIYYMVKNDDFDHG